MKKIIKKRNWISVGTVCCQENSGNGSAGFYENRLIRLGSKLTQLSDIFWGLGLDFVWQREEDITKDEKSFNVQNRYMIFKKAYLKKCGWKERAGTQTTVKLYSRKEREIPLKEEEKET